MKLSQNIRRTCGCIVPALLLTALALTPSCSTTTTSNATAEAPVQFGDASPLQWSVRMAMSEMERRGEKLAWTEGGRAKWDYTAGLFTLSLLKLNETVPNARYVDFTKKSIGSFITPDGNIQGYKMEDYNIDNIAPGKTVLALWKLTKEERYKKCAELLRKQLVTHPRTSEGGFWHKQRYPYQMWLDGLFMGAPFYAEYTKLFNGPAADYDDITKQYKLIDKHLYDEKTGLFWHGWDEKREQEWANRTTGLSSNFWGRAVGWYVMACVDVLDFLPKNHKDRPWIISHLKKVSDGIVKWQDPASGLWWQVMDRGGDRGNYLEATASAMFVYAMAKGINKGYLNEQDYKPAILKGYTGIIERLIKTDANGKISLTRCCSVAGLGYGRDGSYEYYLREPVVDNDLKGVGPLIFAGIELQQLLKLPVTAKVEAPFAKSAEDKKSVASEWSMVPTILARINEPYFPGREYSIIDFGAAADGKTDCTAAIAKAIDACVKAGGGRVVVPAGEYITGPIELKSKINLHLDGGATLKFKTDPKAYLPAVLTRFEGMECYNYSPLIYAYGQDNIAITGEGVLDGQADNSNWWPWKGKTEYGWANGAPQQKAARDRLIKMVEDNVPVAERKFGEGDYLRPSFIQPYNCSKVLIEGVRIRRSPMWEIHPVLCTNVTVRGVNIVTHGPNNDGCNPEASRDVLIEDCLFDTGDDCIAIKSGRNNDGRRLALPSENIIIRRCTMKDGHGGVVLGSEISGGARNIFVEDCSMDSPNLDRALRLKSNAVRGGTIENIFMRNITVGQVADAVLQIDFLYEEGTNGNFKPVARNIVMENITVSKTPRVLNVAGFSNAEISNIRIHNSNFKNVAGADKVANGDVKLVNCLVQAN
jgi:unsaturated rhamnogalacturonyl hydrolase